MRSRPGFTLSELIVFLTLVGCVVIGFLIGLQHHIGWALVGAVAGLGVGFAGVVVEFVCAETWLWVMERTFVGRSIDRWHAWQREVDERWQREGTPIWAFVFVGTILGCVFFAVAYFQLFKGY